MTHKRDTGRNGVVLQLGGDVPVPEISEPRFCLISPQVNGDHIRITTYVGTSEGTELCAVRETARISEALAIVEHFLRRFATDNSRY